MEEIKPFWSKTPQELAEQLNANLTTGLSFKDAEIRLKNEGHNTIIDNQYKSDLNLILTQFKSPFMILLLFADILSFVLGEHIDAIIIFCIIILSGLLSFWQERGAQNIIKDLLAMVKINVNVWRENSLKSINLEAVVSGDIIHLSAGDIVPADALLFEAKDLFVNEAMLTGEPYPEEKNLGILPQETILKDRNNTLYKGTHITSGFAKALVVLTGRKTEFGQITEKIKPNKNETEFEKGLKHFGYMLMEIALVLALVIFAINVYYQKPFIDSLLFSLALTIGITPFLLPAIVSVNLAYGAKHMAKNKVIVKRLVSIENFGSMNVFCSDKTGTLTSGEITIHDFLDAKNSHNPKIMEYAFANAMLQTGYTNPIDEAIKNYQNINLISFHKLDEIPFDFTRKRLSILIEENGCQLMITKGTFKKVIEVCKQVDLEGNIEPLEQYNEAILKMFEDCTSKGFRVIAVAYKKMETVKINRSKEKEMIFLGLILLDDPIKEGVIDSVKKMKEMGIKLKILTGDNKNVSQYVGKQLKLNEKKIIIGSELNKLDDNALMKKVGSTDVFAELEPSHKERIVRLLSQLGNVVGYIGDGVNDVSALQASDVGISVNNAVDVAKNTADFVLLEKDLKVLLQGIIIGRKTFVNTIKYIFMTTSANFGNIISMASVSLFLPFLPLLPKQILATNFISDLPAMTMPSDNVDHEWVALPKSWNLKFIKKFMIRFGLLSSFFDFLTFATLIYVIKSDPEHFRSGWFMFTILTEFVVLWVLRSKKVFYKSKPGKLLLYTTLLMFVLGLAIPYTLLGSILELPTLPLQTILILLIVIVFYGVGNEMLKRVFYKKFHF